MLGAYLGQTYLGQGYPINRIVLFLSDALAVSDQAPTFDIGIGVEDTLILSDEFPKDAWFRGLGALYLGQTYFGGAIPKTIQVKNISSQHTTKFQDTIGMEDFLGTEWDAKLNLSDTLSLTDQVRSRLFASVSDQPKPSISTQNLTSAISSRKGDI